MELIIYDRDGEGKMRVPAAGGTHDTAIHADNVVSLNFTVYECVQIDVNDYIEFLGERFWATERYIPEQKSTVEWHYQINFYGIESLVGRFLVLRLTDNANEAEFTLTAPAAMHLKLIVDSINAAMGTTDWKAGEVVPTGNLAIDYHGIYCNEALAKLAEAAGTEFWFDGTTVNLTRCEHGNPVTLGYDKGLLGLYRTAADNVRFFTRLFPIGSDRNIDREKYGFTRLQLPEGVRYIERDTETYGVIDHYEKDAFSDIYPRRVGTVSSVRETEAISDDGSGYRIYWFKDDSLDFNPNDHEIAGLVKNVTFQSGELNGRDFEVNYNSQKKEFEIITQWPYDDGMQLPGGTLVPKPGDKYVLWNISMPDEYYALAEQEYAAAVDKFMNENRKDVSVYKAHTDYVDILDRDVQLRVGQRVRLESFQFFPGTGYKDTRITRISRSLENPTDMDIEMSDVLSKGTIASIESGLEETKSYVDSVSGSLPGIVKSWEGTRLTDTNIMSSARTMLEIARQALSRVRDDIAAGVITFLKEIKALSGITFGRFQSGKPGAGGAVLIDKDGNSSAEVDFLTVRKNATFNRLTVQEAKHVGGRLILSSASMLCSRVEEMPQAYRCYFETEDGNGKKIYNTFEADDQAIRQDFNTVAAEYYWRLVTAVGENWIELSKTDCDTGSGVPKAGDEIVHLGNRTNKDRQSAQILSAFGSGAPSYIVYNGIDSYSLGGKDIAGIVYNSDAGEPQAYNFGSSYTGDRDPDDPESTFITYQKKEGERRKGVHIKGSLTIGSGSSGLENLSEWQGKQQQIDDAGSKAEEAREAAQEAQTAADDAAGLAETAKNLADLANNELDDIKSDSSISPMEKTSLRQQLADIESEYGLILKDAAKYSVSAASYTEAYSRAKASLTRYTSDLPEYITIEKDYDDISAYYTSRQTILDAISTAARKVADDAQAAADKAQTSADAANSLAQTSKSLAEAARKAADAANAAAGKAQAAADTANQAVGNLNDYVDGAFKDGIISEAEAVAIEKYRNSVNETKKAADAAYTAVYSNALLTNPAKSNLAVAKTSLDTATSNLLKSIETAIADRKTTSAEKQDVDAKYAAFNTAYGTFTARLDEAQKAINAVIDAKAAAAQKLADAMNVILSNLNDHIIPDLQNQVDGAIESWSGDAVPTLANYPASDWENETELKRHVGDYYDRKVTVDGKVGYERYRFEKSGTSYKWQLIADNGGAQALAEAQKALGIAEGKSRIFYQNTAPSAPYKVDDLWIKTDTGTIYVSLAARESGSNADDWAVVNDALLRMRNMASDKVITREEKASYRNQWSQIQEEYRSYQEDAAKYGISVTSLTDAYNSLKASLTGTAAIASDTDTTLTDAQRTEFNRAFSAWNAEVSRFQQAVSQKQVDDVKVGGRNLLRKTNQGDVSWRRAQASGYTASIEPVIVADGTNGVRLTVSYVPSSPGYSIFGFALAEALKKLKPNTEYVLSFDAVSSIAKSYYVSIMTLSATDVLVFRTPFDLKVGQNHVEVKIITSGLTVPISDQVLYLSNFNEVSTTDIWNLKLEEGNKATAWSAAPEDVDAEIDTISLSAENAKILAEATGGRMIYRDPEFKESTNHVYPYDNAYSGALTLIRKLIEGIPNSSGYGIEITTSAKGTRPGLGGFVFGFTGRENGQYVCSFIAKIPEGYKVQFATNNIGTGSSHRWLTSNNGTGKWERYAYYVKYGINDSGINDTFYFYIESGAVPMSWQLAYATVFDLAGNSQEDVKKAQSTADSAKSVADTAAGRLDKWADDGTISPTEKPGLKDELARIDADKTQITNDYAKYDLGAPQAFIDAHKDYRGQLVILTATTPENIGIPESFRGNQTYYYTQRTAALNAIATAAKAEAEKAGLYRKTTVIDATGLDQNMYYLVTLPSSQSARTFYQIDVPLFGDNGIPSWSGHKSGFTLNVKWSVYGNGWGALWEQRIIEIFSYRNTNGVRPAGSIGQMTNSSTEYIYVRGGAKYPITVWGTEFSIQPTLRLTDYTASGQTQKSPIASVTAPSPFTNDISKAQAAANAAKTSVDNLNEYVDGAFQDGVVQQSEAKAIKTYINTVNESFADLEATYKVVHDNEFLSDEQKKALESAMEAFSGKKDALIKAIDTAIADGKAQSSDVINVNNAFADYNDAVKSFKTALENANKAIQQELERRADAKVATVEYLKNLFPEDTVTIENGFVLGRLIGVSDEAGNVVAGFNGSDKIQSATDKEHGKLLQFLGAKDIASVSDAATRMYEDGTIVTRTIEILPGGKIGPFNVVKMYEGFSLMAEFENTNDNQQIILSHDGLSYKDTLRYGSNYVLMRNIDIGNDIIANKRAIFISSTYEKINPSALQGTTEHAALYLSARGSAYKIPTIDRTGKVYANMAIRCEEGIFAGLRPIVRTVSGSIRLSVLDHTIVVDADWDYYAVLTLPDNPEPGQEYLILTNGHQNLTGQHKVRSQKANIHYPYYDLWSKTEIGINRNSRTYIVFASDKSGNGYWWVNNI